MRWPRRDVRHDGRQYLDRHCHHGLTTFVFSVAGVKIGKPVRSRYQSKAELVGGLILIAMGFKILVEHLLGKA